MLSGGPNRRRVVDDLDRRTTLLIRASCLIASVLAFLGYFLIVRFDGIRLLFERDLLGSAEPMDVFIDRNYSGDRRAKETRTGSGIGAQKRPAHW